MALSAAPSNDQTQHIVDVLIDERAEHLRKYRYLWPILKSLCKGVLGYNRALEMVDATQGMSGLEIMDYMSNLLHLEVSVSGEEHIPANGPALVTPNHPAGIADGIAVFDAFKHIRDDICFVANRDAIRANAGLADIIIPVEWRVQERNAQKTRETVRAINQAFKEDRLVVIFPSGRLAEPTIRGLKERPWQTTALSFARRNEVPVIPMHIKGENTVFYYVTWYINTELKDMTLFREIVKKEGRPYRITVGEPFHLAQKIDINEMTERVREFVLTDLKTGQTRFSA
ncbi:MAG: 1-acyl-sn-glycerol-3-phosphate acyltransferase [Gammaproteobacteria bacterium]|nr:1-acyl-sn-glycerol-3-phosphate acyltransferase [Gammaproteobacteria bacterium]